MKRTAAVLSMLFCLGRAQAQESETYVLHQAVSNRETIVYRRVIRFDDQKHLFHVQDYYENGRIQMDAFYTSFDKRVKEEYQCNYRSNTKEGPYREWHRNGRMRFEGHFTRGRLNGASTAWYESGQKEAEENRLSGQLHGRVIDWREGLMRKRLMTRGDLADFDIEIRDLYFEIAADLLNPTPPQSRRAVWWPR